MNSMKYKTMMGLKVRALCGAMLLQFCFGWMYTWPVLIWPLYAQTGWSATQICTAFACMAVVTGVSARVATHVTYFFGAGKAYTCAAVLIITGPVVAYLIGTWFAYLSCWVLVGIGIGIGLVAPQHVLRNCFRAPEDAQVVTMCLGVSFGSGCLLIVPVIHYLLARGVWVYMLTVCACSAVVIALAGQIIPLIRVHHTIDKPVVELNVNNAYKFAFAVGVSTGLTTIAMSSFILVDRVEFDVSSVAVAVGMLGVTNGAGRVLWLKLTQRCGIRAGVALALFLQAICLAHLFYVHPMQPHTLLCCIVLGYGGLVVCAPAIFTSAFAGIKVFDGRLRSIILVCGCIVGAVAVIGAAVVYDLTGNHDLWMKAYAAACMVAGIWVTMSDEKQ